MCVYMGVHVFQGNTECVFIWEYMCFRAILNVCLYGSICVSGQY